MGRIYWIEYKNTKQKITTNGEDIFDLIADIIKQNLFDFKITNASHITLFHNGERLSEDNSLFELEEKTKLEIRHI